MVHICRKKAGLKRLATRPGVTPKSEIQAMRVQYGNALDKNPGKRDDSDTLDFAGLKSAANKIMGVEKPAPKPKKVEKAVAKVEKTEDKPKKDEHEKDFYEEGE